MAVNLSAAEEIARQLRLRDMGGIVVVDFIDMHRSENRKTLYEKLKEEMETDRAKHKILPPSRFGLVEITRQRVRPEMAIQTREENPDGNGEVEAPILIIDEIENNLGKRAKIVPTIQKTLESTFIGTRSCMPFLYTNIHLQNKTIFFVRVSTESGTFPYHKK